MSLLKEKDFCLMPSLIIETFGLSALESLRAGTPVIGFKKGGTEPFISDSLAIEHQQGGSPTEQLYSLIKKLLTAPQDKKEYLPHINFDDYSSQTWIDHFQQIAGNVKRILLVSDFTAQIGGIENYLHDTRALLEKNGYEVSLWGTNKRPSRW